MNDILAWITSLIAAIVPGFGTTEAPVYYGYAEADYVYVAPTSPGIIHSLDVKEGDAVTKGEVLFAQSTDQFEAALRAAEAQLAITIANRANQSTGGRPEELKVIEANLAQAEANLDLAQTTLKRTLELRTSGFASNAQVDQSRTAEMSASAEVDRLRAQLEVAKLPARDEALAAADASITAARANLESARIALDDRTRKAPIDGRVERLNFSAGEMAPAGAAIVALLPADGMKVKFYVPEAVRPQFALGDAVAVDCDGCQKGMTAVLTYFASEPQFTPPVIYSRDERTRLSFLIEARLDGPAQLLPGQPVSIGLLQ